MEGCKNSHLIGAEALFPLPFDEKGDMSAFHKALKY